MRRMSLAEENYTTAEREELQKILNRSLAEHEKLSETLIRYLAEESCLVEKFTTAEREELQKTLKKYPAEKTKKFISHLEFYCQHMLHILSNPSREELKEDTAPMLTSFKTTLSYLKQIEKGHFSPFHHDTIHGIESERGKEIGNLIISTSKEAWTAVNHLTTIIELIENSPSLQPGERGHATINKVKKSFVVKVAELYENYLEKPTLYRGGEFYAIVGLALKAVGLQVEEPRRLVEYAVHSMRNIKPPD